MCYCQRPSCKHNYPSEPGRRLYRPVIPDWLFRLRSRRGRVVDDYYWFAVVLTPLIAVLCFALAYFTRPKIRIARRR
jgi:hypothetical protein